jgi:multiple sugar transport system permease protein
MRSAVRLAEPSAVTAALATMTLLVLFPLAWIVGTSLKSEAEALHIPVRWWPTHPTVSAYVEMWTEKPFLLYFVNSTAVSGATALATTVLGALAGYGFSRFRVPAPGILLGAILATQMLPGGLLIGPYFRALSALDLYDTRTGLALAFVTISLPFAVWMSKAFFDTVPREIDEAARVDGATRWQALRWVIAPLAAPGLVAIALFSFLLAWQDLLWSLVLTSTDARRTVPVGIMLLIGLFKVKWPMLCAAVLIAALPPVALYLALHRYLIQGLTVGAIKG